MSACAPQTPLLYPAPAISVPSPPPGPLEEVLLDVPQVGEVVAWYLPAPDSEGPVIVFFHGNGENLETMRLAGTFGAFASLGMPLLAVDFPGYGRSRGKASETTLVASAVEAVGFLRQRHPGRPLVAAGWSLGSAVALQVAVRQRVEGLVLMSPWTTLADLGRSHFPGWMVGVFVRETYDSIAAARSIEAPALVIHGAEDDLIPAGHGRRLAQAMPGARWLEVSGAGHNDLLGRRQVWEAIGDFLEHL